MMVCPLDAGNTPRAVVGGKGRSPVWRVATPPGFVVTIAARVIIIATP